MTERITDTELSEMHYTTVMSLQSGFKQVSCEISILVALLNEISGHRADTADSGEIDAQIEAAVQERNAAEFRAYQMRNGIIDQINDSGPHFVGSVVLTETETPAPDPIDATIHHNARLVTARISEMADKFLGLQPAESKPLELLEKLSGWVDRLQFDVSHAAAAELANEWVSADSERPPAGTDIRFRVGGGSYAGRLISLPYGEFMRSDSGDFALHIVKWRPRIGAAETVVPGAEPPPASEPGTESWWYARHPDDERWDGPCDTYDEAITTAFSGHPKDGDVVYVVKGERPTTDQLAEGISADWILDCLVDYAADAGLMGDDHELEFKDQDAFESELQEVIARHLVRPDWYACDGSQAEMVTYES